MSAGNGHNRVADPAAGQCCTAHVPCETRFTKDRISRASHCCTAAFFRKLRVFSFSRTETVASNHTVTCPHCMNHVPWGAHVCRGCQAEIHYGTPRIITGILAIVCLLAGWYAAKIVRLYVTENSTVLWIVFAVVFAALAFPCVKFCKRLFADRTMFKRLYRK